MTISRTTHLGFLMIALAAAGCAADPDPGATADGGALADAADPRSDGGGAADTGADPDGNIIADMGPDPDGGFAIDADAGPDDGAAFDAAFVRDAATPADAGILPEVIRFALEVANDIPESIYVQLTEENGQPGWVTVHRDGERIWFERRCEIVDCDGAPGICDPGFPQVRDITGGTSTGAIDLFWDGRTSVRDPERNCERRVPAPPGDYVATFCWSLRAETQGAGDPEESVAGRVLDPTCVDVPFTFPGDDEVVHRILGG